MFGGINTAGEGLERSRTGFIENHGVTARTYAITYEFIQGGRNVQDPTGRATLNLSETTITVPAGGTISFEATIQLESRTPNGYYEGFVTVTELDGDVVARLPFAVVAYEVLPTLQDVHLYRPVISTSEFAHHPISSQLGMFYTPNRSVGLNTFIVRAVPGMTEYNWESPQFEDAFVGFIGARTLLASGLDLGQPHRGIVFDGSFQDVTLEEEGDYFLVLEVFRQTTPTGDWQWERDMLLPFSVDNTPPVLTIDQLEILDSTYTLLVGESDDLIISGSVHDEWLETAYDRELTFDIWLENAPNGHVANQGINALWLQVENENPVRVELDANGDFEITLEHRYQDLPLEITFFAIDNYSIMPRVDAILGTTAAAQVWIWNAFDNFIPLGGLVHADPGLNNHLRLGSLFNFAPMDLFNEHVWTGLNVTEKTVSLVIDEPTTCLAIANGRFVDAGGSEWRICEDGTLEIDEGFVNWTGALSPWHNHRALITQVEIGGPITAGPSLRALFRELTEVTVIEGLTYFDTTATTTMYRMFFGLGGVTELDVTSFDTRNVTSMALMFRDASSLVDLDVSGFDTRNVTDMREMFRATQLTQLDLSSFDTGNVTTMNHMFTALHTLRELTLGESFSFTGTPNLVPIRQTEEFTGLWQGAGAAFTSAQLMAQFDGSSMAGTFVWQEWAAPDPDECEVVARGRFANGATVAGSEWRLCDNGTLEVDSGFINWTLVTSPWHAHRADITEIVFTGDITAGTSLRSLFHDLFNLEEIIGLEYFDTRNVTNMGRMFRGASSLTEIDLSNFDTRNVVDMGWMFFGASGLESLDVTGFDTSNVVDMGLMFREMSGLVELDVTGFETSNVRDMREMFRGMSNLEALDLSSFDTSSVMNMNHMFVGLASLQELILGDLFTPIGSPGIPRLN